MTIGCVNEGLTLYFRCGLRIQFDLMFSRRDYPGLFIGFAGKSDRWAWNWLLLPRLTDLDVLKASPLHIRFRLKFIFRASDCPTSA